MNDQKKSNRQDEDEVTEIGPVEDLAAKDEAPETAPDDALTTLTKERDEFKDKFLRTYADLENYRKRVTREKEELVKFGHEKLFKEIITIKDNIDRALDHRETADLNSLKEGLEMIEKDLNSLIESFKVETIEAEGQPFDPEHHEALAEEESPHAEPGTVLSQYQKGYRLHGRLLRPARVVVAKSPKPPKENS